MNIIEVSFGVLCAVLFTLWTVFTLVEDKRVKDNLKQFQDQGSFRREVARRKKQRARKVLFSNKQ